VESTAEQTFDPSLNARGASGSGATPLAVCLSSPHHGIEPCVLFCFVCVGVCARGRVAEQCVGCGVLAGRVRAVLATASFQDCSW